MTDTVERGAVVRYHGTHTSEHVFPQIVVGEDPGGRYRLACREYPEFVMRQVRRQSFTTTGETVALCQCDHEFTQLRPNEHVRCGVYQCGCHVHESDSVAQVVGEDSAVGR